MIDTSKKSCPICINKKIDFSFKARKTSYYKCASCGLVFALRLPRVSYQDYDLDNYFKLEGFLKNAIRKQVKGLKKYKPKGKVLEIGSGMGYMMEILKDEGYQVEGIEPSESLVDLSLKKGLKVKKGYFEKLPLKEQSFDIVILNHVLEHVPNPIKFLGKVKKILRKDGILFLQVPNFGSFEAQIMQKNWSYLVPNDHYLQFSHQTMQLLLKKTGFNVVESKTTGVSNELDNLGEELVRCLRKDQKRFVYYLINYFPALIENAFNRGAALWYIAR